MGRFGRRACSSPLTPSSRGSPRTAGPACRMGGHISWPGPDRSALPSASAHRPSSQASKRPRQGRLSSNVRGGGVALSFHPWRSCNPHALPWEHHFRLRAGNAPLLPSREVHPPEREGVPLLLEPPVVAARLPVPWGRIRRAFRGCYISDGNTRRFRL
jgi:hypothetical protein